MPDDLPQEKIELIDRTAQYYINLRITEVSNDLKCEIKDLKGDIAELKSLITDQNNLCADEMNRVEARIGSLEGYKNRAVGAIALFLMLVGMWRVA